MPAGVEEKEFADDKGLDDHDRAGCNNRQQADDIEHPYHIEDDVSWSSQGFSETAHDGREGPVRRIRSLKVVDVV